MIFFFGLFLGVPLLAAVATGSHWVLLLPVLIHGGGALAASLGWIATGENWELFVVPYLLVSLALTVLGLFLHGAIVKRRARRRVRA